jgi:hypothetical protein
MHLLRIPTAALWACAGLILCSGSIGSAYAYDTTREQETPHHWEVNAESYYHNYEEPGVMEQDGIFYGVGAAYEYAQKQRPWFRYEGRFAWGQVDYTSPVSGTLDDIDDFTLETRGLLGYAFGVTQHISVTPFAGFGYRYLNDDSQGRTTNTGAVGYERESNYYYSPIGLQALVALNETWTVRSRGEYDFLWKGRQKNRFSEAIAGLSDLENDQDEGYGLRGSLGVIRRGEKMDVTVDGFVRYWDIEDSDLRPVNYLGTTIGLGYEPANETIETGAVIGLRF